MISVSFEQSESKYVNKFELGLGNKLNTIIIMI